PTDADLTVFIDGAQAGTMPTISKQLSAGSHTIKVVADGYNEEIRKIDLSEGETKTIKINLKEK
ncbi:MAG: PEGA domain-containing protein, partial [Deltaproteobacteria bacterium]|nr:PEGA domain-containing protein [Deltaproteobacteria bacterium]